MKRWGLRFEIVVSLSLLAAAAAGIMGLVVFKYIQQDMIAQEIKNGVFLARILEERLNLVTRPGENFKFINGFDKTGFDRFVVVDKYGTIIASSENWDWKGLPSKADLTMAMSSREAQTYLSHNRLLLFSDGPRLSMALPMIRAGRVYGAIGLYSEMKALRATWTRTERIILFFLALDTIVTVIFGAYLLSRRVVRPLRRMVRRVEALAAGKYEPGSLDVGEPNEIGVLEESFEVMAARLIQSQARLEKNLTDLKEAQEHLVRSEKMASVGRLAAGLAHELGNPLGAILGFIHLLKRVDLSDEERADFLKRAESELNRMDGIIRSLLDFARQSPAEPGPVDVLEIIEDALALAEVQKWFNGIDVVSELEDNLPEAVGDKNRLTQVLLNLLANAGQAMNGAGTLTLSAAVKDVNIVITVADDGPGIAREDLPHIFEPFYTSKEPGQGTGLGLSVSLSIVESFGGKLDVQSELGKGSVFNVILVSAQK